MEHAPIGSIEYGGWHAEIHSTDLPGEFKVCYHDGAGKLVEEGMLTGVSTYHQRESDIRQRLKALSEGNASEPPADLTSSGEY
jgi:hypothetical protein